MAAKTSDKKSSADERGVSSFLVRLRRLHLVRPTSTRGPTAVFYSCAGGRNDETASMLQTTASRPTSFAAASQKTPLRSEMEKLAALADRMALEAAGQQLQHSDQQRRHRADGGESVLGARGTTRPNQPAVYEGLGPPKGQMSTANRPTADMTIQATSDCSTATDRNSSRWTPPAKIKRPQFPRSFSSSNAACAARVELPANWSSPSLSTSLSMPSNASRAPTTAVPDCRCAVPPSPSHVRQLPLTPPRSVHHWMTGGEATDGTTDSAPAAGVGSTRPPMTSFDSGSQTPQTTFNVAALQQISTTSDSQSSGRSNTDASTKIVWSNLRQGHRRSASSPINDIFTHSRLPSTPQVVVSPSIAHRQLTPAAKTPSSSPMLKRSLLSGPSNGLLNGGSANSRRQLPTIYASQLMPMAPSGGQRKETDVVKSSIGTMSDRLDVSTWPRRRLVTGSGRRNTDSTDADDDDVFITTNVARVGIESLVEHDDVKRPIAADAACPSPWQLRMGTAKATPAYTHSMTVDCGTALTEVTASELSAGGSWYDLLSGDDQQSNATVMSTGCQATSGRPETARCHVNDDDDHTRCHRPVIMSASKNEATPSACDLYHSLTQLHIYEYGDGDYESNRPLKNHVNVTSSGYSDVSTVTTQTVPPSSSAGLHGVPALLVITVPVLGQVCHQENPNRRTVCHLVSTPVVNCRYRSLTNSDDLPGAAPVRCGVRSTSSCASSELDRTAAGSSASPGLCNNGNSDSTVPPRLAMTPEIRRRSALSSAGGVRGRHSECGPINYGRSWYDGVSDTD